MEAADTRGRFEFEDPPSRRYSPAAIPTRTPSSTKALNHTQGERPSARLARSCVDDSAEEYSDSGAGAVSGAVNVILSRSIVPDGVRRHPPFGGFAGPAAPEAALRPPTAAAMG